MTQAFIVGALRTPVGRRKGALADVHPADLAGHVLAGLVESTGVDPAAIDDVILGCVGQAGAQSFNIARTAVLSAGLPESVPGTTIDRQCGSSQQAVHFASQAIRSGDQDIVIAGGIEVMSLVTMGSSASLGVAAGMGHPRSGKGWAKRYGDTEISQFRGAEAIAAEWNVTRDDMEEFALRSHRLAADAVDGGVFDSEILPYGDFARDEGPRRDSSKEKLAALKVLIDGGSMTAAVSSQISDGAAALMIASERAVERHGLVPLARVHTTAMVGCDPVTMLSGPIPATASVLKRSGLDLSDISAFEVNEAFAPIVLAWQRAIGAPMDRTNVNGGAIALGHPLGATGARLMTSLVHHLQRTGGRYGLQTMCEGGGMANATVLERV
ncbi:acetyl-CoA C-acyltransferase [Rhodococcus fascians]|nr:acetyl-CoA C-acyltransferase [Rhodococcus fascians]MBY4238727.1 acetyl-CoA C-acyltransferase [Rhodococcus fascians]MBY4254684.1 acetyl-CoA C-acyltransferase [Rhodococcus fascians]MBY4270082.1 acetyl-CoA C-acyltransferase [Rhodococcus fascians]